MAKARAKKTDVHEIRQRLRGLGLRTTGARIAVLRLLETSERPVSHHEVAARLEPLGFDPATIFRNLTDLTQVGLLARTDLGDRVWRFEFKRTSPRHKEQHPHFLCTGCGQVLCLPDSAVKVKRVPGGPKALGRPLVVQVQGICDSCA